MSYLFTYLLHLILCVFFPPTFYHSLLCFAAHCHIVMANRCQDYKFNLCYCVTCANLCQWGYHFVDNLRTDYYGFHRNVHDVGGQEAWFPKSGGEPGDGWVWCTGSAAWDVSLLVPKEATVLDQGYHRMAAERLGSDSDPCSHGGRKRWLSYQRGSGTQEGKDSGGCCHWCWHLRYLALTAKSALIIIEYAPLL